MKSFRAKCDVLRSIWYHWHNLKKREKHPWRKVCLVKLLTSACNFSKSNTSPWAFSTFFNCTNIKLHKASQILRRYKNVSLYSANGVESRTFTFD